MDPVSFDPMARLSPELQQAFQAATQAERRPLDKIAENKAKLDEKAETLGKVIQHLDLAKGKLPGLHGPAAIREVSFTSANPGLVTGTADRATALPGEHSIEVLQLASGASSLSNTFPDRDSTSIGTGFISLTSPSGETHEIFVDPESSTLDGVTSVINSAGIGFNARVIADSSDPENPYRLLLTAPGAAAGLELEYPEMSFIDGDDDLYFDTTKAATNARVRFQGMEMELEGNRVSDLIPGVALELRGITDPGRPVLLQVDNDAPKMALKIKDVVGHLNEAFALIQEQSQRGENSSAKPLQGDYGIRMAESRLRGAIQGIGQMPGALARALPSIGIQFDRNGVLQLDEQKLTSALTKDFEGTVAALSGDGGRSGLVPRLAVALDGILKSNTGLLVRQRSMFGEQSRRETSRLEDRSKAAEKRLETLRQKLGRAEVAMDALKSQAGKLQGLGSGEGGFAQLLG